MSENNADPQDFVQCDPLLSALDSVDTALERYWTGLSKPGTFWDFVNSDDSADLPPASESQAAYRLRAAVIASMATQAGYFSFRQGSMSDAWEHACDAKYHLGLVHGPGVGQPKDASRLLAILSHKEDHDSKRQVIEHYRANKHLYCNARGIPTKDAAAEAMTLKQKLVPYPFRTVRNWLNNE
jgi:hypothetical protein